MAFCQLNIYTGFSSVRLHELTIFFPVVVYQDITANEAEEVSSQKKCGVIMGYCISNLYLRVV
ncbi:hypothetical protein BMR17_00325 [Escherichia coli]|nr:predicted protein [Escherichia coli B185]EFN7372060.1 hypothetical protein [Escherichia coli]KPO50546.1 hypothetical protein ACU82_11470 [Escherichia coli]MGS63768.1 hypothetical protein [Escherichia coli]PGG44527.1 hypothetical protein BMR16_21635 [Escherichia coli]